MWRGCKSIEESTASRRCMRCSMCCSLLGGAALAGVVAGWQWTLMTGFWTWMATTIALVLLWTAMNLQVFSESLEVTPLKITSWVVFVILFLGLFFLYQSTFAFPTIPSIILGILTAGTGWWTYYTLEPAKA